MAVGMKKVIGKTISSRPLLEDWDEGDCLCQGQVPDDKRIDIQQRIYDEKREKHRWRNRVRYHQDCPIHGLEREHTQCRVD